MQNDGGVKRGDRAATGDNEAKPRPDVGPGGSGKRGGGGGAEGHPTGAADSLGGRGSLAGVGGVAGTEEQGLGEDLGDLSVVDATDGSLGLTNVGDTPADDWAADTGPTRANEGSTGVATADLSDYGSTLGPDRDNHRNVTAREDVKDRPERTSKR